MYEPTDVVTSPDQIYELMPPPHVTQQLKIIDHIDTHIQNWIAHSTFVTMATVDATGNMDVSPKGDPAGFVIVVDAHTLAIPDRPGNHRYDSFLNIMETGRIGLVFLVPNRTEVVRVNGSARVVRDQALRERMAIKGRVPDFAILVRVQEAFFHCGKAVIRSQLWQPEVQLPVDGLPTYAEALIAHGDPDISYDALDARLRNNDKNRLYDE